MEYLYRPKLMMNSNPEELMERENTHPLLWTLWIKPLLKLKVTNWAKTSCLSTSFQGKLTQKYAKLSKQKKYFFYFLQLREKKSTPVQIDKAHPLTVIPTILDITENQFFLGIQDRYLHSLQQGPLQGVEWNHLS